MKICYVGDAAAIHTQRWVQWFAASNDVIVVSTDEDDGLPEYKVATLPGARARRSRLLDSVLSLRAVLSEHRPDILHCHYVNEAGWFGAAARWRPLVITAWGSDVYRAPSESLLARRLNPWATRRADWVTCDSNDQARVIATWGVPASRLSMIGWGVDRLEFNPSVSGDAMRARLNIPQNSRVVLSPRQWYLNSNIPSVIAAHERLAQDVYLILKRCPGFEPDNGLHVEQAIAASSARDRIRVLGQIEPDELPEMHAAADVVVSLCATDGTSASLLEAMAAGRPVVALDVASLREWVAEPGGILVPSLDPGPLAAALSLFLNDPAARAAAAQHNIDVVTRSADRAREFDRMSAIYQQLLAVSPNGSHRGH